MAFDVRQLVRLSVCAAVLLPASVGALRGEDLPPPPPKPAELQTRGATDDAPGLNPEMSDPSFDRYVDLSSLPAALGAGNAEIITDIALQLAEGERVLLRSHKAFSAKSVMEMAVKLATDTGDKASLSRLAKAYDNAGDKARSGQLSLLAKAATGSRSENPALAEGSPESLAVVTELQGRLREVRLSENGAGLADLMQSIANHPGLSAGQKEALNKEVNETRKALPANANADLEKTLSAIKKLEGASRYNINPFSPENNGTWRQGPLGHWYRENFWFVTYEIWAYEYTENGRQVRSHLVARDSAEWGKILYGNTTKNGGWRSLGGGKSAYVDPNNGSHVYMDGKWQSIPVHILPKARIVAAGGGNIVAAGGGNLIGKGGAGIISLPSGSQAIAVTQNISSSILPQKTGYYISKPSAIVAAGGGN